jgi:hypothetical protein
MKTSLFLLSLLSFACNSEIASVKNAEISTPVINAESNKDQHWEGAFTNGMKQTYISFDVSADGKQLKNLTFKGYWYCSGKLTQDILGPEENFTITNNAVNGVITEPEGGGATATRYDLKATFKGSKAEGSFRMNINALGCDTRVLTWTATKK